MQNCASLQVLKEASASSAVHMIILSDANTVFIDNVLEAQGLQVSKRHSEIPRLA